MIARIVFAAAGFTVLGVLAAPVAAADGTVSCSPCASSTPSVVHQPGTTVPAYVAAGHIGDWRNEPEYTYEGWADAVTLSPEEQRGYDAPEDNPVG